MFYFVECEKLKFEWRCKDKGIRPQRHSRATTKRPILGLVKNNEFGRFNR